jgi:hypothetical protein
LWWKVWCKDGTNSASTAGVSSRRLRRMTNLVNFATEAS